MCRVNISFSLKQTVIVRILAMLIHTRRGYEIRVRKLKLAEI